MPIAALVDGYEGQIVQRMVRAEPTGELLDLAVMLQVRSEGGAAWQDMVRVDRAHGDDLHVHRCRRDGTSVRDDDIIPAHCRKHHDDALNWALAFVWDLKGRFAEWA
jgi:hypothetical protein